MGSHSIDFKPSTRSSFLSSFFNRVAKRFNMSVKNQNKIGNLKTCFKQQVSRDDDTVNHSQDLPLPDVVLCSSLTANIIHSRRQRDGRRRHPASVQTPAYRDTIPDVDPDLLMEPLINGLESVSMDPNSGDSDDGHGSHMEVDIPVDQRKRRRTTSASEAAVLSTIAISSSMKKTEKIQDHQDGFLNTIKSFINNIFSN